MRALDIYEIETGDTIVVYSNGEFNMFRISEINTEEGTLLSESGFDISPNEDDQFIVLQN